MGDSSARSSSNGGQKAAHILIEAPPDLNDKTHPVLGAGANEVLPDRDFSAGDSVWTDHRRSELIFHSFEITVDLVELIPGVRTVDDLEGIGEAWTATGSAVRARDGLLTTLT